MADSAGGWCLIESDPGVFTELVDKVGVKGLQFEEIYDLDSSPSSDAVAGLIFLFKYEKQEPREVVQYPPPGLFFAKQVITNACATQAILSILLNSDLVADNLGQQLTDFKGFTKDFDPETRGLAISNQEVIKAVHNSFSRQSSFDFVRDDDDDKEDSFHFIAYVPYKGKVYELDGLQPGPIEIKGTSEVSQSDWMNVAKPEIKKRIEKYASGEVRFNLMAITKDDAYSTELQILKHRLLKQRASIKLVSMGELDELEDEEVDEDGAPADDDVLIAFESLPDDVAALKKMVKDADEKISTLKSSISEHLNKKDQWRKENERRRHDYVPFLLCALKHLAKKGTLVDPMFKAGKEKAAADYEKAKAQKEAEKANKAAAAK